MYHIVYQSTAVGHPTTADLKWLLQQSRTNNAALGITGLLLYGNGNFLQVLEGEEQAVQLIYARIVVDQRHMHVLKLSDGPIERRIFGDWSMGFQPLKSDDFVRLTGYINPYRSNFLDAHLPEIDESMLVLLKSFVLNDGTHP